MDTPVSTDIKQTAADFEADAEYRAALIDHLLTIGTALSSATDLDSLLRLILGKCREITCSDAGSVFLVNHSMSGPPRLNFKIAQNDSLPSLPFEESMLPMTEDSLAGHVALTAEALNIADAYDPPPGLTFNRGYDHDNKYRTCSLLVLPMLNQQRDVIGVIQLINRKKSADLRLTAENAVASTQPYSAMEQRIILALAAQAAISIERNHLIKSIEDLFEGFVRASVDIIEARDPTTAGHSERVAALTVRLAEEVSSVDQGPLRAASFSDRQLQEIRYASLLHDFGKVGVPTAVLLKAKKLYPEQVDAMRYRFALARRDIELQCSRQRLAHLTGHPECATGCSHETDDARAQEERQSQLDEFWDLLMRLNEPQVVLKEQSGDITERLRLIANYRYRGVMDQEEPLITDRELQQLLVRKGSLTEAERQAIESHVSQSFQFLSRIPWTAALKFVPQIAHGHHEKLDGTGYPLGLNASQIPLQSQMMTVCDIYDALSASDRPYKKALSVERAISILREEADLQHVNKDLLLVFEQKQVYQALTPA